MWLADTNKSIFINNFIGISINISSDKNFTEITKMKKLFYIIFLFEVTCKTSSRKKKFSKMTSTEPKVFWLF